MLFQNRKSYVLNFALILALFSGLFGAVSVHAATLTVTNINDSGAGSLRQAIADAISGDTITFDPSLAGQTITLSSTLVINKNLTIDGSALASKISLSGNNSVRAFDVTPGIIALLNNLVVKNGYSSTDGGGIYNSGSLTVMNSNFLGSSADSSGGGIYNIGTLDVIQSTVSSNSAAYGGGINNSGGTLTVTDSSFTGNTSSWTGGGITNFLDNARATVVGSTFYGNSAVYSGGGIISESGAFEVINSTFSGNAAQEGGGAHNFEAVLTVKNSTFSGNKASNGGGIYNDTWGGTINLFNSILANNVKLDNSGVVNDCYSGVGGMGSNINNIIELNASGNNACGVPFINTDPNLGLLTNNGGFTQTMALLPDSPALDAGDNAYCPATDQRGVARPQGSGCDIGAYEFQTPMISPGDTVRVSVDSSGAQGDGFSSFSSTSADGRFVVFESSAPNLVPNDTNATNDIFRYDIQTGEMARVSFDSTGMQANGSSSVPSISADGRYITFESHATNLVSGDTNAFPDVFVRDMQMGVTMRVSVDSNGMQANGRSYTGTTPVISADGRYVTFHSSVTNLVPDDTNTQNDIFVHDIQTGNTTRASVDSNGAQSNGGSAYPSISADGHYIAFISSATNLVSGDTNAQTDVFVHDTQTGSTILVSLDSNGMQGNGSSGAPSISENGRYVAFHSSATNLVLGDTNAQADIFVRDLQMGNTVRVSVDSNSVQANDPSVGPSISADGRYVAFPSLAANLVPDDTNGVSDAFIHDLQTGTTKRVSVDSSGAQAITQPCFSCHSLHPSISADGHYVTFTSYASNLVQDDTNSASDVFVHRQEILPIPPTPTPTNTPTETPAPTFTNTPTETSTPTNTPTLTPTPVTSCDQITSGSITKSGNSMSMAITNPLTIPIQIQDVFVVWNHDKGHEIGSDKTLNLNFVSLGSQFWSGTSNGPSLTITPSPTTYIPSGTSTITFAFHQSYEFFDGTEQIIVNLATNGCQSHPVISTSTATSTPTNTFTPTATPPYSYNPLYLSLTGNQTIGGVASADEDILKFDGSTWSLFFDGSDVGVGGSDLFGFSFLDADSLLLSFTTALTLNGISVTPQDVVRFDATSLGSVTTGTFSMYLDGSDVGFDTTAEKIDSVSLLPDGRILLSTTGNPAVVGVTGAKDEDVLAFTPTSLGDTTSGTWSMYFDGSDVGLAETSGEDVDALDVTGGKIYLSTADSFTVNGVSGADEDVFVCIPTSVGEGTGCNYSTSLYFDGSTWGLTANDVDAFNFLTLAPVPTLTPTITNTPTNTPTPTFTATITPTYTPVCGPGFGVDGIVITNIDGADEARGVAVQSDGKIVVVGDSSRTPGNFSIVRYKLDGTLDSSFDGDGKVTIDLNNNSDGAYGVAIQPDGKIVVAGTTWYTTGSDIVVMRFNSDGSLDTTFDTDGIAITTIGTFDYGYDVALQANGKIVVTGRGNDGSDIAIVRYNTNGSLDTTFSSDGIVTTAIGSADEAHAIALQDDDKIIVAGRSFTGSTHDFAVLRYNTNGSLDTTFDTNGIATTAIGNSYDYAYDLVLQPDGKIILVGETNIDGGDDFGIIRYNPNGTLDTTFDMDGILVSSLGLWDDAQEVAVQSNGQIIVAGTSSDGSNADFAVARYNSDGSLDNTFSDDGMIVTDLGSSKDFVYGMVLQSDNDIVLVGRSHLEGIADFAVTRYKPNGSLDTSTCTTETRTPTPFVTPTNSMTPTVTHTPTATLTSTPTNTYTPTIIPSTPGLPNLIFADGYEAGNLSEWTSNTIDLGDLSASAASALVGNQGMQALIDDNNTIYVTDDNPNAEPTYRARFYFDPNSIPMLSGDAHFIFKGFMGTSTEVLRTEFRQSAGSYQLRMGLLDDGATWINSNWFTISDASHFIEMDWHAATGVGANNGSLTFWIDGILQASLTGVDNDTRRIDRVRLGALTGIDNGTRGTYYFDAFESHRQTYIGP